MPNPDSPLNLWHIRILQKLADSGAMPLTYFNEVWCNDLFRRKPKLIAIVPGFDEPVIDITAEGRQVLTGGTAKLVGEHALVNKRAAGGV